MSTACLLSIIICTYNRSESLEKTLQSLLQQENCNNLNYEVIVIDNNSTDKTKEIVENFNGTTGGKIRYALETNQGLSFARNKGINAAKGKTISFIDDDIVLPNNFINNVCYEFSKLDLTTVCLTGRVEMYQGTKYSSSTKI